MSNLKDILAISGHGGLFKFISQGRSGIIVESLVDKKRSNMPSTAKVSSLEDIAIYTEDEEKPLVEILRAIKEKNEGKKALSEKPSNDELKNYFEEILPNYDKDRVYVSDIKKIVKWYNLLVDIKMLDLLEEDKEEKEKEEKGEKKEKKAEEKKDSK